MYFEVKTEVEIDITYIPAMPVEFLWHLICIKTQKSIQFISKGTPIQFCELRLRHKSNPIQLKMIYSKSIQHHGQIVVLVF